MKNPVFAGVKIKDSDTLKEALSEYFGGDADILNNIYVFNDYEQAFIGVTSDNNVVYDHERMIDCLMNRDGISYEDAVEFIEFNTLRTLPYLQAQSDKHAPVILYGLDS